jgi:hypothetical protein
MVVVAPLSLLAYGILRWVDGLDGDRRGGAAWNVGHLFFLLSVVLFAVLADVLVRLSPWRVVALVAAGATWVGAACMGWVIVGDLSADFRAEWSLPHVLEVAGPPLFAIGLVALLVLQVVAGRVPVWSPVLFFLGFVAISVELDLLPPAALLITAATLPLVRVVGPGTGEVARA